MDPRLFPEGNLREISLGLQGKVLTGCPVFVPPIAVARIPTLPIQNAHIIPAFTGREVD